MGLKTLNQKMEYLRNGVRYCLLLILLVLAFATGAHAAQDDYYYPNYDASANGCVDLMNYVKRVTVTVNGVDYTLNQLDQMRQQGTPLTMQVGDTISFNVLFGLQGRAYDPNDATLVDESNSTYVTYTHDTTMLDGTTVAAGSQAILDDSSLMKENTTKGNSYLRMDIGWLLDACRLTWRAKLHTHLLLDLFNQAREKAEAEANAAKYLAAEACAKACETAIFTHGGMGYAKEYHVERYLRESWIPRLAPVSPQLILCFIAEKVLGLPKSY